MGKRIHTEVDEELDREWRKSQPRGARVTVRLNTGETYTDCVHMLRAMTADDVNDKFRKLAAVALNAEQCERMVSTVRSLDTVRDVSSLVPLLTFGGQNTKTA